MAVNALHDKVQASSELQSYLCVGALRAADWRPDKSALTDQPPPGPPFSSPRCRQRRPRISELTGNGPRRRGQSRHFAAKIPNTTVPVRSWKGCRGSCLTWLKRAQGDILRDFLDLAISRRLLLPHIIRNFQHHFQKACCSWHSVDYTSCDSESICVTAGWRGGKNVRNEHVFNSSTHLLDKRQEAFSNEELCAERSSF